jgi:hypothetical protein
LQVDIHLADFIEQQGATIRFLKFADAAVERRLAGMAAQLTAMNGLLARLLFWWI